MSDGKRGRVRGAWLLVFTVFFTVFFLLMAILGEVFEIIRRAVTRRRR
jgi:hypothetical protein